MDFMYEFIFMNMFYYVKDRKSFRVPCGFVSPMIQARYWDGEKLNYEITPRVPWGRFRDFFNLKLLKN